jgi:hypothetical protein
LAGADEETVELRLLGDSAFQEEFDITVDEIALLYASDKFTGEEKTEVEKHFLKSPERQHKVKFMGELLRQAANSHAEHSDDNTPSLVADAKPVIHDKPSLLERFRAWWGNQSVSLRAATTFATVIIAVGVAFLAFSGRGEPSYQPLELAMVTADRSAGNEISKVKLGSGVDGLRIKLKLPENAPAAKGYRAEFRGEKASRQLTVEQQDSQSLTVLVPANELTRGSYAIELSAITDNGTEVPLRGAYLFEVY